MNGSTIASKFNYSIILDDGPVVATVPFPARLQQGTPSPTSFEAPIDRSENDRNTVHSQELVSPCGPPPYSDLQETTCALTEVFPGPTYQYHLKTSSGSLVCSAVYEGNGVSPVSFACLSEVPPHLVVSVTSVWMCSVHNRSGRKCQCCHHPVCNASKSHLPWCNRGVEHGILLAVRVS